MIILKVKEKLLSEYNSGCTYQALAKKYGVSYAYLRGLILGSDPISRITLETFERMFPNAYVSLTSNSGIYQSADNNSGNVHQVAGDDRSRSDGSLNDYQLRLYRAMAGLDIAADAKLKVLEALNQLQ